MPITKQKIDLGFLLEQLVEESYPMLQDKKLKCKLNKPKGILFMGDGDKIPEYKLERIFEKFYRGDESRTSETGGAGLGLAITKQIIELHNGKIITKNDDEFIEFYISLK